MALMYDVTPAAIIFGDNESDVIVVVRGCMLRQGSFRQAVVYQGNMIVLLGEATLFAPAHEESSA